MHILTRAALVLVAFAVAFAVLVTAPRSSVDAHIQNNAGDLVPVADVSVEAYTEAAGPSTINDGDDTNDVAAFSRPNATPEKRRGDSVYIRVFDVGPGDADPDDDHATDDAEAGSLSTLFRFSVHSSSDASGTFKSGGKTSLNCSDNRGTAASGCDMDRDNDELTVQFDISASAQDGQNVVIQVDNVTDNKSVRVIIEIGGSALSAGKLEVTLVSGSSLSRPADGEEGEFGDEAQFRVRVLDNQQPPADYAGRKVTLTVTRGVLRTSGVSPGCRAVTICSITTDSDGFWTQVRGAGQPGPSTLTIEADGFTQTRTITFYGDAREITAEAEPAPNVVIEGYTEAGGGADDGDDSNDIAAFSAPSASPVKRAGDSVYIQITDVGPGDGGADPPEPGSLSTLFRFTVHAASDATGTFTSGGRTSLNCADNRGAAASGCDRDRDVDEMTVQFDISAAAKANTHVVIDVYNVTDNKTVRVVIEVIAGSGRPGDEAEATPTPAVPSESDALPASYYGGGLRRGDVVIASIGGAGCGEATVDAYGGWSIRVDEGGCGGKAVNGATIAFTVNGRVAEQTAVWRPGGMPSDLSRGITLTVAANERELPASYYGGGLDAGDVVTASIGGAACSEATVDARGGWSILVEEGGCGGKAVDGAVVAFAINGVPAGQTATWRAGGLPDDREDGIPLTAAGMTIRLRRVSAVYVLDVDGGFDIHVAGAPDFVNARFGQRWVAAATPFTLTLGIEGVRALYVQSTDRTFDSHIVGAPDFVNAAFARRWVVDAIE